MENEPQPVHNKTGQETHVLIILFVFFAVLAAYSFGRLTGLQGLQMTAQPGSPSPTQALQPTESQLTPTDTTSPTAKPTAVQTGIVSGKLCYPAESLPKGTIEAKSTTTSDLVTQNYIGSAAGGLSSYSFDLKPGKYYLRYKVDSGLSGYHSETCKTGVETTCAEANPRVLIVATVEAGKTVDAYDLCDFYYSDSTKPTF